MEIIWSFVRQAIFLEQTNTIIIWSIIGRYLLDIGHSFGLFCIVVAGDVDIADIAKNFEVVFYVVWPEGWLVNFD